MDKITELLLANRDEKYAEFSAKLSPTLDRSSIIGVRVPVIRSLVKELSKEEKDNFINTLPHKYQEENQLHGFILQKLKPFDEAVKRVDEFLPYVNNWAVSDVMMPKIFSKGKDKLLNYIKKWLKSSHTYTVRFAIDCLMNLYLDDDFKPEYLNLVSSIQSNEYYVNMMIAWYLATALAKQYETTISLIESKSLNKWVHNKAIQKAIESNRISDENKAYIKTLKIA